MLLKLSIAINIVLLIACVMGFLVYDNSDPISKVVSSPKVEFEDLVKAAEDYLDGKIGLEDIVELIKEDLDVNECDINISLGDNELNITLKPLGVFDPWIYDVNKSCYIEMGESLKAASDYFNGFIEKDQANQVVALYMGDIRNPACDAPPPPPPPTEYLNMSQSELYSYLIDGSVAADWWSLSYNERKQLGLKIIQWWSFPIRAYVRDKGGIGCNDPPMYDPYLQPVANPLTCQCYCEAGLRYFQLGSNQDCRTDLYYWEQLEDRWICFYKEDFNLPIFIAGVSAPSLAHWVCAIQIGQDLQNWNSWIFFNLDEVVVPGNPRQMPYDSTVGIFEVIGVRQDGFPKCSQNPIVTYYNV